MKSSQHKEGMKDEPKKVERKERNGGEIKHKEHGNRLNDRKERRLRNRKLTQKALTDKIETTLM